ncbi:MAG: hypothetical protein K2X77_10260 [Candidatus Obscuribacterales bacterium]|jgi:hypothetical protein|nr:hypothetical protein [Candidatus Obscuribacterales bacterium]
MTIPQSQYREACDALVKRKRQLIKRRNPKEVEVQELGVQRTPVALSPELPALLATTDISPCADVLDVLGSTAEGCVEFLEIGIELLEIFAV